MFCNYVFESGGIKGLVYVGALKYFEERGYKCFKAYGSSVGAIFASLCVAKYKASEIENIIDNITKNDLKKRNNLKDGIKTKGIYSIGNIENTLSMLLERKGIRTFQDVKFGDDYLLKIVTTDNQKKKMVILPCDLNKYGYDVDNFSVAKAVAMSCSVPLFYSQYCIDCNRFIDGGMSSRFPIDLISDDSFPTYGFRIICENKIKDYLKVNLNRVYPNCKCEVININCKKILSLQFNKGLDRKQELYRIGYQSVYKYFQEKNK